jgi:hypothetical protein
MMNYYLIEIIMDKLLYKSLIEVALENRTDQWGNVLSSPLKVAINTFLDDKEVRDKLVKDVAKHIDMEDLVESVAEKVKSDFSGWSSDSNRDRLKERVLDKTADILAKEQVEKLRNEE